ncbi:MAG TPA: NYN domain-containing protein [Candidatus Paceibacterota bacterium]|jgi:uncharacterized LabA/DUF88 family protein|nr:NYN domain-containing protein [Candidatus Paceibacterota bacterium]
MPKTTFVYIDSFNLYYGIRKFRNAKWLNVDAWLKTVLPISSYDIQKIKFFTANVSAPAHDPQRSVRQATYFRALETIPTLEMIKGRFKKKAVNLQISKDLKIVAQVPEEKGTDVNLGVHLVNDAHLNRFQTAVVVSNDSDLAEAIAITARDLNKEVWVINPCIGGSTSAVLVQHATQIRRARETHVRACQFNPTLTDTVGTFTKPNSW